MSRARAKGEPRQIPTYQRAIGRCRRNDWRIVEVVHIGGGYRINYTHRPPGARERRPGTLRARV